MASGERLSVIIPSWREGPRLLEAIRAARMALGEAEFLVVAHEESVGTRECAIAEGVTWIDAPRAGRGLQLQLGAQQVHGELLVFLHADSRLPIDSARLIREALADKRVAGGAFRLRFDRAHPVFALLAWLSRSRLRAAFLGDQCLFCTRRAYDAAGGFRALPLFEDVEFVQRIARVGSLVRLRQSVTTSARRFMANGPLRQLTANVLLLLAFHAGVNPARLHAFYEPAAAKPRAAIPVRARRAPRRAPRERHAVRRVPKGSA